MNNKMRSILELASHFHTEAEKVERYSKNPFVEGDNVAEHLARGLRLIVYISPNLKEEFQDRPNIVEEVITCFAVHDDDEVIAGFDIPTAIKTHNANDGEEIVQFTQAVAALPQENRDFLVRTFSSFRNKDTLAAKIAKAIDNVVGNQVVIEQRTGLINPDLARFSVEYAEKVRGISKTIDLIIDAQINQIVERRQALASDEAEIGKIAEELDFSDTKKIKELLSVDVQNHVLDKSKVYSSIQEL